MDKLEEVKASLTIAVGDEVVVNLTHTDDDDPKSWAHLVGVVQGVTPAKCNDPHYDDMRVSFNYGPVCGVRTLTLQRYELLPASSSASLLRGDGSACC